MGRRESIYEANQKNIQTILKDRDTPMDMNHEAAPEQTTELSKEEAGKLRRIPALMHYAAQGRPDAQVAVSHLCSDMSKPTQQSWTILKQIGRYLKKHQRV